MNKHYLTNKHIRNQLAIKKVEKGEKGGDCKFSCTNCSKEFLSNSGLWRHKKKCIIIENNENKDNLGNNSIVDICSNKLELSNETKSQFSKSVVAVEELLEKCKKLLV